jgi:hypothetical protein
MDKVDQILEAQNNYRPYKPIEWNQRTCGPTFKNEEERLAWVRMIEKQKIMQEAMQEIQLNKKIEAAMKMWPGITREEARSAVVARVPPRGYAFF